MNGINRYSDGDLRGRAELKASAINDPFWFVRQSCVEVLGEYRDKALITFLKEKPWTKNRRFE